MVCSARRRATAADKPWRLLRRCAAPVFSKLAPRTAKIDPPFRSTPPFRPQTVPKTLEICMSTGHRTRSRRWTGYRPRSARRQVLARSARHVAHVLGGLARRLFLRLHLRSRAPNALLFGALRPERDAAIEAISTLQAPWVTPQRTAHAMPAPVRRFSTLGTTEPVLCGNRYRVRLRAIRMRFSHVSALSQGLYRGRTPNLWLDNLAFACEYPSKSI